MAAAEGLSLSSVVISHGSLTRTGLVLRPNSSSSLVVPNRRRFVSIRGKGEQHKDGNKTAKVPNSVYATPLDYSGPAFIIRPLAEILRDMNKRVPDQVLKTKPGSAPYIPWYQANRMLSFYAPGWCGEVRSIDFSDDGKYATVVYRVTLRGSDGEAYREASGTTLVDEVGIDDPIQRAEEMAFCRACARFGLGLYLHHDEEAL